jgi:hypothetical protein
MIVYFLLKNGAVLVGRGKNEAEILIVPPVAGPAQTDTVSIRGGGGVSEQKFSVRHGGDPAILNPVTFIRSFAGQSRLHGVFKMSPVRAFEEPEMGKGGKIDLTVIFRFPRVGGIKQRVIQCKIDNFYLPVFEYGKGHLPRFLNWSLRYPDEHPDESVHLKNAGIQKAFHHHILP